MPKMALRMVIDITIESAGWPAEAQLRQHVEALCKAVFDHLGFGDMCSELSLLFTDDTTMQAINNKWRGQNKPTNVLSFPAFAIRPNETPKSILGDIILAFETITREAQSEGKNFDHHLNHLILHGLLHLLGYDHEREEEAIIMEGHEIAILRQFAIPNPYE